MDQIRERPRTRYGLLSALVLMAVGGAYGYTTVKHRSDVESTENFDIAYPAAKGAWKALPHGPQTLFLYGDKAKGLLIRGAVNQMISSENPTPDLDRDNLAQLMVDNTHDNMPGWTAAVADTVEAKGTSFRLVRRSERKHVVVTAFAVRGNTTVLISLSGRNDHAADVDRHLGEFRQFLADVTLTKADSSKW